MAAAEGDQGEGRRASTVALHRPDASTCTCRDRQAGGEIATQDGDTWKAALNSPRGGRGDRLLASFYKDGLDPKAAVGWEEPDAQTAFVNGDVAMLIAGGWTYNSIIATKPELEKEIGTELTPAGPPARARRSRAAATSCEFQESKNKALGAAFVDFMLKPRAAEQVHQRDRLPAGDDGGHQGVGLPRGPDAQAVRRAAARPPRRLSAVAEVGRPGGREHLRR